MEDAAGFFANVFGGERFVDYVRLLPPAIQATKHSPCRSQIGEISIMKDMTSVATTMMTEEEKAEIEKQMNSNNASPSSPAVDSNPTAMPTRPTAPPAASTSSVPAPDGAVPAPVAVPTSASHTSHVVPHESSPSSVTSASLADKEAEKKEAARRKAEQREKLREHDKARRKAMEARVAMLTKKMIERIRPFVEAKDPGGKDDLESNAFTERMKREVEDLKLESFGVEVGFFNLFTLFHLLTVFTAELLAPTYHWKCLYDESVVFHEVKEILGDVSDILFAL